MGIQQIRLFEWRGTEVFLHPTFILLPLLIAGPELLSGQLSAASMALSYMAVIFFCIVLHEFGHIAMAKRLGFQTGDVVLTPLGGLAQINATDETARDEILIAAAGPAVNLVIIALSMGLMTLVPMFLGASAAPILTGLYAIVLVNTMLAVFNLIPLFPMDGGRIWRGILRFWMAPAKATRIAVYTGWAIAAVITVLALMIGNLIIPMIAAFMCFIGYQELDRVKRG